MATPGALGAKRLTAFRSVSSKVQRLAELYGLDQALADSLAVQGHNDPKVTDVRQMEAFDSVIGQLVQAAEAQAQLALDRQAIADEILGLEGMTKTSSEVIKAWAAEG